MTVSGILKQVDALECGLVEITGGEPLIQEETPALIERLVAKGYDVLLETNGSVDIGAVTSNCIKILDIKCPSSNESNNNDLINLGKLTSKDQIKFVLQNHEDYEFAKTIINQIPDQIPGHHILFSPVTDRLQANILAKWILDDHLTARLQLQLHKIIWPDIERGV